jgi:hypothetical protein
MTKALVRLAWLLALAWPSTGAAQYDWESGTGNPPPTTDTEQASSSGSTASSSSSSSSPPAQQSAPQGDDHQRVVGHIAVGYLGINQVPVATVANLITAPAIGVRYWFSDLIGLDVGLGLGYTSQVSVMVLGGNSTAHDVFGFIVHAGVPIAPAHTDHFVFEITPEANFGVGSGNVPAPPGSMVGGTGLNGLLFQLGGRAGAELHFGFIGVPQLSLTASVGLYFQYQSASINPPVGANMSGDLTTISTTVMGQPWQIFAGTISAFYYFD